MRVLLAKYTDVEDLEVEKLPSKYHYIERYPNATRIRWQLPELTDKEAASIRREINDNFGPADLACIQEQVLEWQIEKRSKWSEPWYFEIICDRHHNATNDDKDETDEEWYETNEDGVKNGDCSVSFHFHNGYYEAMEMFPWFHDPSKPATVEFLVQVENSFLLFNNVTQTTRDDSFDRFTQFRKAVPADLCKQLRRVTSGQIQAECVTVTVFGVFEDGVHGISLRSKRPRLASPELNWKIFEDQQDTDVTIVAGDGELIDCHWSYITRNSRVLSDMQVPFPRRKPYVLEIMELNRNQVVAFLRYQYSGASDKILESPATSLGALKASERYDIRDMWVDTMDGLLQKDSDWFERDVIKELTTFLVQTSQPGQKRISNLLKKLSMVMRQQRSKELVRMLESPTTSISFLKMAQFYENDKMWNDIISTLLEKGSNWFESDLDLELKTYLDTCDKRCEKETRKLARTLSRLSQQTRAMERTGVARERNRIQKDKDNGNGHCQANIENENSTVGSPPKSATFNLNVRRSARLQLGKLKTEVLQTDDESRKRTLKLNVKKKKAAPKPATCGSGPTDIQKDPLLPKIAITLYPEVKVEKVDPPEEDGIEDSVEMAGVAIEQQFVQEMDAEAAIDEEPIPMDNSSVSDFDVGEFGVVKLDIEGSN